MSKYTTEVRFICETEAGLTESSGFNNLDDILNVAAPKIFNFDFPMYDENYRLVLEKKILRHFYTREICEETVGLWKLRVCDKLNLIMPYYNELYRTTLYEFNPLYDTDYRREKTTNFTGSSETTGTGTNSRTNGGTRTQTQTGNVSDLGTENNSHWDLFSDTPQSGIVGIDNATVEPSVGNNAYLTNARHVTDDGGSSNVRTLNTQTGDTYSEQGSDNIRKTENTEVTNEDNYIEHVFGKMPGHSYPKLIREFRNTILNIDKLIIDELEPLFFGLW